LGRGGASHARPVGQVFPNAATHEPGTQVMAGRTPAARSCRPTAACRSGRTSAQRLTCIRAILRATGVSLSAKRSSLATAQVPPRRRPGPADAAAASVAHANSKHQIRLGRRRAGCEHGGMRCRAGLSRGVCLPTAPSRSTNSPVRTEPTRTRHARISDARTGHQTPDVGNGALDIGHRGVGHQTRGHRTGGRWTRTGRRTLAGSTLDTRTLTEDVWTGEQGTVGIGHPGATTSLGRRTV
jgi:hypothetical protein